MHRLVCRNIGHIELSDEECKSKLIRTETRDFASKEEIDEISAPDFTMKCSSCNAEGFQSDKYCAACGRKFEN